MKPDYKNWIPKGMLVSLIAGTVLSLALLLVFGVFGIGVSGKLISAQFDSYRRSMAECTDRKTAGLYMDATMVYHFGGWAAFLKPVNKSREEK